MAPIGFGSVFVSLESDGGRSIRVQFLDNFRMTCACRVDHWCDHRGAVVNRAMDVSMLRTWMRNKSASPIAIPIFPTRNLYFDGTLSRLEISGGDTLSLTKAGDFLGVIGVTEGLGALRQIVLAALDAIVPEPGRSLACKSVGHRYSSERGLTTKIESNETAWLKANDFSVWQSGKCLLCRQPGGDGSSTEEQDWSTYAPAF